MTSTSELDLRTPVIIGVGQVAERLEDAGYKGLSPIPFTHVTLPVLVNGVRSTEIRHHAPALGEQTDELLAEIGLGADDITALRNAGVVGG